MDISPQRLSLARDQANALARDARSAWPVEACGLLIGRRAGSVLCATRIVPPANVAGTPDRFEIDPAAHLRLQRQVRGTADRVIGCWHSHPTGPPEPSPADVAAAIEANFIWLIYSVAEARLAAWWHHGGGRFSALMLDER